MDGVKFGDKHSYDDFGLLLTAYEIGMPEPKTEFIDIPGMDGGLDLTETLSGDINYYNRSLSFTFTVVESAGRWDSIRTEVGNYLHGRKLKIILDQDSSFYYVGRCKINLFQSDKHLATLVIEVDAEPYKYDILSSSEDWLWDDFNFENGIIYETIYAVNGTYKAVLLNRRKKVCPIISCTAAMTAVFEGKTYSLAKGENKIIDIQLSEGENQITFQGTGTVTVDYRGGSL